MSDGLVTFTCLKGRMERRLNVNKSNCMYNTCYIELETIREQIQGKLSVGKNEKRKKKKNLI